MTNETNALIEAAVFSEQIKSFLMSDLGQYILNKGDLERDEALTQLATVDPTDVKTITKLQNDIKVVEFVKYWLSDAIEQGLQAQNTLDAHSVHYE